MTVYISACCFCGRPSSPPQLLSPRPPPLQVSVKGRTSMVSLLQMASYSGRCVLVRMLSLRGGGARSIPLSLMEVLRDPHVLKVGVGCYEDAKRLIRDHGLAVGCTVDLRYLVLRRWVRPRPLHGVRPRPRGQASLVTHCSGINFGGEDRVVTLWHSQVKGCGFETPPPTPPDYGPTFTQRKGVTDPPCVHRKSLTGTSQKMLTFRRSDAAWAVI